MKNKELMIGVTGVNVYMRVSRATFYKIVKIRPGVWLDERTYVISLESLKKHPRLYNQYRRLV